ncbi:glycosyl hydrolase [Isoptericola sediminis]|uniref:glucan endo-1,3-beta-D-glucosidase n=1 Tax=Isoptericola sediminis TaxID=2733572 RepID=A0A849K0F7_9MICO|nr:1,3-beta-glucanase [Isoptericola sediminis]
MTRRPVAVLLAVVLAAAGCTTTEPGGDEAAGPAPTDRSLVGAQAPAVDPTALPTVEREQGPMRLADGLPPPTNRWFSGLVFGDEPQPVFPLPLAVGLTSTGFAYGLPDVRADGTLIAGGYAPQVQVDLGESVTGVVSRYDAATVDVDLVAEDDQVRGTVHLTRGSPVVRYTARTAHGLGLDRSFDDAGAGLPDGVATAEVDGRTHALVGVDGLDAAGALDGSGSTLELGEGESVAWLAAPDDPAGGSAALPELVRAAGEAVEASTVSYATGTDDVTTTVGYETTSGGPAVAVRFPHQRDAADDATCGLGSYATVLGTVDVCRATELSWRSTAREPVVGLDVSDLGEPARDELVEQVRADADRVLAETRPADTYFGGKALARDAELWTLARDLGMDDVAADLRASLLTDLRLWTDPDGCEERPERCFTWEPTLGTVVGQATAFGSEEGNDHHFHYGYFLYAAGLLAAEDAELAEEVAPVVDLLAADVAAAADVPAGDGAPMPALRTLDVVMGHSWASGPSPFGDGNNQESASEAVAAWHGLALWADARAAAGLPDEGLTSQARWMLSLEAASARAYWTDFDRSDPVADGLQADVTSLVWDGKRERATWFSAEPSAALGIVVLPVTGVSTYLGEDPARVRDNLAEALGTTDLWADDATWDVMFGDQLLMYAGLMGPEEATAALEVARELPEDRIDDGSTRSWLLAWLHGRAD